MCRSQWEETRESKAGLTTACAGLRISRSCAHARVRTPCPLPSTSSSARVCASPRSQTISLLPIHPQVCLCVCVCVFASMHMCMRTHARMCASSRACVFSCAICTGMCHTLDAGIRTNLWLRPLPMRCVRRCMYVQIYAHGRERKHACVHVCMYACTVHVCALAHAHMHPHPHPHPHATLKASCALPALSHSASVYPPPRPTASSCPSRVAPPPFLVADGPLFAQPPGPFASCPAAGRNSEMSPPHCDVYSQTARMLTLQNLGVPCRTPLRLPTSPSPLSVSGNWCGFG